MGRASDFVWLHASSVSSCWHLAAEQMAVSKLLHACVFSLSLLLSLLLHLSCDCPTAGRSRSRCSVLPVWHHLVTSPSCCQQHHAMLWSCCALLVGSAHTSNIHSHCARLVSTRLTATIPATHGQPGNMEFPGQHGVCLHLRHEQCKSSIDEQLSGNVHCRVRVGNNLRVKAYLHACKVTRRSGLHSCAARACRPHHM